MTIQWLKLLSKKYYLIKSLKIQIFTLTCVVRSFKSFGGMKMKLLVFLLFAVMEIFFYKHAFCLDIIKQDIKQDDSELLQITGFAVPPSPELSLPKDSTIVGFAKVSFFWKKSSTTIKKFLFELATNSIFSDCYKDSTLSSAGTSVSNLIPETKYWWRVKALDETGWGDYSLPFTFTTKSGNLVDEASSKSNNELITFPNPASESITVSINYIGNNNENGTLSPYDCLLEIYNSHSNCIIRRKVSDSEFTSNKIVVNLVNLSSGEYYALLINDYSIIMKKFIVIK